MAEACWHDFGDPGTPEALVAHVEGIEALGGAVDVVGLQFQVQTDQTDPTRFRQGQPPRAPLPDTRRRSAEG